MNATSKPQFTMKSIFLLMLLAAMTARLFIVTWRHSELIQETSSLGKIGGPVAELRTKLGYLEPLVTTDVYMVPIPSKQANKRSFRLYLPKSDKLRVLKLGMTDGSIRNMLPTVKSNWPIIHSFDLSKSQEQIISIEWSRGDSSKWMLKVERTDYDSQFVEIPNSDFLENPEGWLVQPLDLQGAHHYQPDANFDVWVIQASKRATATTEIGQIEGFQFWVEVIP